MMKCKSSFRREPAFGEYYGVWSDLQPRYQLFMQPH